MRNLIIITGCPGTGKSYWAAQLLKRFPELQLLSYDDLKERFFDLYGFDDNAEKAALNERSLQQFYVDLESRMREGADLLIEYPFNKRHAPALSALIERWDYRAVTVYLYGQMDVIYARSCARDANGRRHPGHLLSRYHKGVTAPVRAPDPDSRLSLEEFIDSCAHKNYDIRLGCNLPVDVTDYAAIDSEAICAAIAEHTTLRAAP